jgi:NAD-reducing hydrogenase large subunit
LKFPFLKSQGYPDGMYRVGPLARLNVCDKIATPRAQKLLQEWRKDGHHVRLSSFHYHWARLIEIVYALERIEQLLDDADLCSTDIVTPGTPVNEQGVGVIEAPRGTLFHHYWVDENGRVEKVNLIVATGHNNLAMNHAVMAIAEKYVKADRLQEGMLNRVEAAIRCYDPCLSCSTHAVGQMPLQIQLVNAQGAVVQTVQRD